MKFGEVEDWGGGGGGVASLFIVVPFTQDATK